MIMDYDNLKQLYDVYYKRSIESINNEIKDQKRKNTIIISILLGFYLTCLLAICITTSDMLTIVVVGIIVFIAVMFPISLVSGSLEQKSVNIHCKFMYEELLGNIFKQYNIKVNSKREPKNELRHGYGEADDMSTVRSYSLSGEYRGNYFKHIISEGHVSSLGDNPGVDDVKINGNNYVFLYSYIKLDKLDENVRSKSTYFNTDSKSESGILKKVNNFINNLGALKFKDKYGDFFIPEEMEQLENICKSIDNICDITIKNKVMAIFVRRGKEMMFYKGTEEECLNNLAEYISNINKLFDIVLSKLEY